MMLFLIASFLVTPTEERPSVRKRTIDSILSAMILSFLTEAACVIVSIRASFMMVPPLASRPRIKFIPFLLFVSDAFLARLSI